MPDALAITMADNIGKQGPALSATSDIPVLSLAPAPAAAEPAAAPTPPAAAPADAAAAAPPPAVGEGEGTGEESKDTTPPWMKAEITKERNRRRDAELKVADAERRAAEATARLDEALKLAAKPPVTTDPAGTTDLRPARESFDDPQAYDEALIEWSSRRAAAATAAETKKAAEEAAAAGAEEARKVAEQAQVEVMRTTWETNRAKALEQLPDYAEVAENPAVQISMAMASVITTRPDGPQIAYHLGKNPELAAKIAALTPPQAVFELGLIAAELKLSKAPQLSNAPEPVRPLGSRAAAVSKGPEEESMEEYAARRTAQLRARH